MPADFFFVNFALFAVVTAAGTFGQSYLKQRKAANASQDASGPAPQSGSSRSLWRAYILVYALVMGPRLCIRNIWRCGAEVSRYQQVLTGCKACPRLLQASRSC